MTNIDSRNKKINLHIIRIICKATGIFKMNRTQKYKEHRHASEIKEPSSIHPNDLCLFIRYTHYT